MTRHDMETTLISILKNHDAFRIGIFGSHAHGEAGPESDLDVLVYFNTRKSLLSLVKIKRENSQVQSLMGDGTRTHEILL